MNAELIEVSSDNSLPQQAEDVVLGNGVRTSQTATRGRGIEWSITAAGPDLASGNGRVKRCDDGEVADPVDFALLYRTPQAWRISIGRPEELACGALEETPPTGSFETAVREFEALLESEWGVSGPLVWVEFEPGRWGVDLAPGARRAAGERTD